MRFLKKLFGINEATSKNKEQETSEEEIKPHTDLEKFKQVPWMTNLRLNNVAICLNAGFRPSNSLPTEFERELRPSIEIAKRLNAIKALVLWLMIPQENIASDIILNFIENNDLKNIMSEEEKETFNLSRDDEQARNAIGWKFENAWSLAWFFGYTEPEITGKMMSGEQMQVILQDFTCPLDENIENWTKDKPTLSKNELIRCVYFHLIMKLFVISVGKRNMEDIVINIDEII